MSTIHVLNKKENNVLYSFEIHNIDVSYVNGLRRVITSEIPTLVFNTSPHAEDKSNIIVNDTSTTNVVLKHQLSCIPIYIPLVDDVEEEDVEDVEDVEDEYEESKNSQQITRQSKSKSNLIVDNYQLVVDIENDTDMFMDITTEHFHLVHKTKPNKSKDEEITRKAFVPYIPPSEAGNYYIQFARLPPRVADKAPRLHLTCDLSIKTCKENGAYNVVSKVVATAIQDETRVIQELEKAKQLWKDENKTKDEIKFYEANWLLLDAKRFINPHMHYFEVETLGIYDAKELIRKACNIMIKKLEILHTLFVEGKIDIHESNNIIEQCYDIKIPNDTYTLGNIIEHELYALFFESIKDLEYISYSVKHPQHNYGCLTMALHDKSKTTTTLTSMISDAIKTQCIKKYAHIKAQFMN